MNSNPENQARLLHNQAIAFTRQGRLPEAIAAFERALTLQPESPGILSNLGTALQEAGRLDDAIATYHKALLIKSDVAGLHINLANALLLAGRLDDAAMYLRYAIRLDSNIPQAHNTLANVLRSKGQLTEAISCYQQAIALRPDYSQALNNLAATYLQNGDVDLALEVAEKTVALHPQYPEGHNTLGNVLKAQNKIEESIAAYQRVVALNPHFADAHNNLGVALMAKGLLNEATQHFQRALGIDPNFLEAINNLGFAMKDKGLTDQAKTAFEKALSLNPNYISAHLNLGLLHRENGNLDQSVHWYEKALALEPKSSVVLNGLANAEKDRGNLELALDYYRQALAMNPGSIANQSNYLYTLHFHPAYDAQAILKEHLTWAQQHAEPLKTAPPPLEPIANRRLRIAYVSPDFRTHVVGRCLLPLLANHDKSKFEIFVYTDLRHPDAMTDQLRSASDHWQNIIGVSNAALADKIRADKIDILVDLTLHASGTRLLAFVRKPAPIQLTWLGYPSTTGITAMDYRLSDPYLDPPGSDSDYAEQTIRLPKTYWCYQPASPTPDVSPLPATTNGHITFGCLNKLGKISAPALELFARLLLNIPTSTLTLYVPPGSHRDRLVQRLADLQIPAARIAFFTGAPWEIYMSQYHNIDMALDPFPYAGGITTCDTLYMGVPVVTLLGQTAVGRGGASILSNLGLPQLIAKTPDQYIEIATSLAADLPKLIQFRQSLRTNMQNSPLMDAPAFARDMENIYLQLARSRA